MESLKAFMGDAPDEVFRVLAKSASEHYRTVHTKRPLLCSANPDRLEQARKFAYDQLMVEAIDEASIHRDPKVFTEFASRYFDAATEGGIDAVEGIVTSVPSRNRRIAALRKYERYYIHAYDYYMYDPSIVDSLLTAWIAIYRLRDESLPPLEEKGGRAARVEYLMEWKIVPSHAKTRMIDLKRHLWPPAMDIPTPIYVVERPSGIANVGNTCYFNSLLQCLIHNKYIMGAICKLIRDKRIQDSKLSQVRNALQLVCEAYVHGNVDSSIIHTLVIPVGSEFAGGAANQDIAETWSICFKEWFINPRRTLHHGLFSYKYPEKPDLDFAKKCLRHLKLEGDDDLSAEDIYAMIKEKSPSDAEQSHTLHQAALEENQRILGSWFRNILRYVTVSRMVCGACGFESRKFQEVFGCLAVEINTSDTTLLDCLQHYFQNETVYGYRCPICNETREGKKQITIQTFPTVLIIQIKRFEFDFDTAVGKKINTPVTIPMKLRKCYMGASPTCLEDVEYELTGVCYHTGNFEGGHYIAFVRVGGSEWYIFNDDISPVRAEDPPKDIGSFVPYLCVYTRVLFSETEDLSGEPLRGSPEASAILPLSFRNIRL